MRVFLERHAPWIDLTAASLGVADEIGDGALYTHCDVTSPESCAATVALALHNVGVALSDRREYGRAVAAHEAENVRS